MTSVFPSRRISHDISRTEEHFIGSHKPHSPHPPSDTSHQIKLFTLFLTGVLPLPQVVLAASSVVESLVTLRCVVTLAALALGCYEREM